MCYLKSLFQINNKNVRFYTIYALNVCVLYPARVRSFQDANNLDRLSRIHIYSIWFRLAAKYPDASFMYTDICKTTGLVSHRALGVLRLDIEILLGKILVNQTVCFSVENRGRG